jgi:hypothetical protein
MQECAPGKFNFEPFLYFTSFDHLVGEREQRWWHVRMADTLERLILMIHKVAAKLPKMGLNEANGN